MRPIGQETCDRIKRLCAVHPQRVVAEIVGLHESQVSKIRKRGFRPAGTKPLRARPADYAIQAHHMSHRDLERHYGAGSSTIARWNREIGRKPRWVVMDRKPTPSREVIERAIAAHGVTQAAIALGTCRKTLLRWRQEHGMTYRGAPPKTPTSMVGWVDRYFQDRHAA